MPNNLASSPSGTTLRPCAFKKLAARSAPTIPYAVPTSSTAAESTPKYFPATRANRPAVPRT